MSISIGINKFRNELPLLSTKQLVWVNKMWTKGQNLNFGLNLSFKQITKKLENNIGCPSPVNPFISTRGQGQWYPKVKSVETRPVYILIVSNIDVFYWYLFFPIPRRWWRDQSVPISLPSYGDIFCWFSILVLAKISIILLNYDDERCFHKYAVTVISTVGLALCMFITMSIWFKVINTFLARQISADHTNLCMNQNVFKFMVCMDERRSMSEQDNYESQGYCSSFSFFRLSTPGSSP